MYFPSIGDPYYTTEGGNRRLYYNGQGIPLLYIMGTNAGNPINYTASQRDIFYNNATTNMKIEVDYAVRNQTVEIDVDVICTGPFTGTNKLRLAIFEYHTTRNWMSNLETDFYHVMKKFAPDEDGINLGALSAGDTVSINTSYTFQGNFRKPANGFDPIDHTIEHSVEEFFDLGIAAWVQNDQTRQIHQAAYGYDIINIDMATKKILFPSDEEFINAGPFAVTSIIQNWQETQVNSADVYYSVNGGTAHKTTVTGLSLNKGDVDTVNLNVPWQPSSPGTYTLRSWVSNPSAGTDEVHENDTLTKVITIKPSVVFPTAGYFFTGSGTLAWFTNTSAEDPTYPSTYFWDFDDDGNTSTDKDPLYAFVHGGVHRVCLTSTNIIGSDTICKLITVPITSLEDKLNQSISVFPNPNSGIFEIKNQNKESVEIRVFASSGNLIRSFSLGAGSQLVNLEQLEAGVYFIEIASDRVRTRKKLVIR